MNQATNTTSLKTLAERAIVRRLVTDILSVQAEDGPAYVVDVWDGEDYALKRSKDVAAIMAAIQSTDEDALIVRRVSGGRAQYLGSVSLIYGESGWDVIADYSLSLEGVLEGAEALAGELAEDMAGHPAIRAEA